MQQNEEGDWQAEVGQLMLSQQRGYAAIRMDDAGIITGWSDAASYITGWSASDALGQSIALIFTPEDRSTGQHTYELHAARETGAAEDERWHMRKDGSRFWASGICLPMPAGDGYAKIFKDATHLRARSKALENENDQLEHQLAERDQALAVVAHELRGPLGPVKMAVTLLGRTAAKPEELRAMAIVDRQLAAMETLINDLLDVSRSRVGKLSMNVRAVDLGDVGRDALRAFEDLARAKGVELRQALPEAPLLIEVDTDRLQQVLSNLLSNALRFTEPGDWIALSATADGSHFLISVKDSGAGIEPDLLPKIFDMFTQASGASSGRGAGLGIGLAVAKEVVALHNGTIEVRSAGVGKGSEFLIRIPITPRREDASTSWSSAV